MSFGDSVRDETKKKPVESQQPPEQPPQPEILEDPVPLPSEIPEDPAVIRVLEKMDKSKKTKN